MDNRLWFWGVVAVLVLGGAVLMGGVHWWTLPTVIGAFGEALLIAGILSATVDRFVKAHLLREVARDAAKYLIGYGLPQPLQDAIRERMATKILRVNYVHRYRLTEIAGNRIRVEQHVTYDVENLSPQIHGYEPTVGLERHDRPVIQEISCISSDPKAPYALRPPESKDRPDEIGVIEAFGNKIQVQPRARAQSYHIVKRFVTETPQEGSDVAAMAASTHNVIVEVEAPEGYTVMISPSTPMRATYRWEYPKLFLSGQHLRVRWFKTNS